MQIASEDYVNKRIYLHADTTTAGLDPAMMQKEHRTRRRTNANGERHFEPMITFTGNNAKGGGKFTPGLTLLAGGVRLVPYDTPHNITILSEIVNIDDGVSDKDAFDRSGTTSNVDIDQGYSPVEVKSTCGTQEYDSKYS